MAEAEGEEKPTEQAAPAKEEPKPAEKAPEKQSEPKAEGSGKGKKVVGILIVLVVIVGLVVALAMFGDDLFKREPSTVDQPTVVALEVIKVGTPGGTSTLSDTGATDIAVDEAFEEEDEILYVFCDELGDGDTVATEGDPAKYEIEGPTWFAYVDEEPDAFFEHDVKFIFIDSSTGEKTVYQESWPPDINGEDMWDAAEDCGGVTEVYKS